ncbi:hypothetical protein LOC71_05315 [Rhodopirellula sp. JC740]|uniref:Uncharacterized protein n=1 Tax=Rhodopirellula halodulae TaxID=2894198 RepID=A0ABS8NDP7_9BACT|nr:hypothetical protein [Rhodopirellula sp. JC740]MCC9641685.1 hypothetical protein [Rhodopirellula sp. JC740]
MQQPNSPSEDFPQSSTEELIQQLVADNATAVIDNPRGEVGLELILRSAAAEAEKQRGDVIHSIRSALQAALKDPSQWSEIEKLDDIEPPAELVERYFGTRSNKERHKLLLQLSFSGCARWAIRLMEINLERHSDTEPENAVRLQSLIDEWRSQLRAE